MILDSIFRKLPLWRSAKLSLSWASLGGEHGLSSHILVRGLLLVFFTSLRCTVIVGLVCNFLWAGNDGTDDTKARVAWRTFIHAQSMGGLGIIDPKL